MRLIPLAPPAADAGASPSTPSAATIGFKAVRLAAALRAGLPVLPGWAVPVGEGRRAMAAGAAAVRVKGLAAGRVAVLRLALDPVLADELRDVVDALGGRVIVRSSSPLEGDARWAGAFSSVTEVGRDDVSTAVRSCWASAFAVDPLERLEECGLPPEALELGVLIQPEIRPAAGGVARVTGGGAQVTVEGVRGHPGALLSGWAEGASAEVALPPGPAAPAGGGAMPGRPGRDELTVLLGQAMVEAVAALAGQVWRVLGDDTIEWAADGGGIWLLQSLRSGGANAHGTVPAALPVAGRAAPEAHVPRRAVPETPLPGRAMSKAPLPGRAMPEAPLPGRGAAELSGGGAAGQLPAPADGMPARAVRQGAPALAADVMGRGAHIPGRPGAPGIAVGRLVACRPHERPPGDTGDAILLVDRPVPALAPLLFGARGVIARSGAAASHLAGVARSLGVPMVIGCRPEPVTGPAPVPGDRWLAAIDGTTGDVALLAAGLRG